MLDSRPLILKLFIVLGVLCRVILCSQNPLPLLYSLWTNSNLHWALPSWQSLHHSLKALCTLYSHSLSAHLHHHFTLLLFLHHLLWSLAKCKAQYMLLPELASAHRMTTLASLSEWISMSNHVWKLLRNSTFIQADPWSLGRECTKVLSERYTFIMWPSTTGYVYSQTFLKSHETTCQQGFSTKCF